MAAAQLTRLCSWTVTHANASCTVRLVLESLQLHASGDVLSVFSGTSGAMLVTGGAVLPNRTSFLSRTNTMRVTLVTNRAAPSEGFVARLAGVCPRPAIPTFFIGDAPPADTPRARLRAVAAGVYPPRTNATWTFSRTSPGCVRLALAWIDTEPGADRLSIVDRNGSRSAVWGALSRLWTACCRFSDTLRRCCLTGGAGRHSHRR